GENTIFKTVCLMDSFQLFEKSSLYTDQLAFIYANGHELRLIAMWNKHSLHALGEYNDKLYLDEFGNIWMQNIRLSDERTYVLAQDTDLKVKLNVLVPPATYCKPIIERVQSRLRAYLNVTCGRPAASVYFHGYNKNQSEIQLVQGMEVCEYKACVEGPALA
ncbi:hypothetical protein ACJMK2_025672, partial [Sinanodonta woodiana]